MSDDLKYDPNRPLYISPNKRFALSDSKKALELAYSKNKPVLIYIHGRANNVGEPMKSEKENIYDDLASYGISVIGFTWDADDGGYDESRPEASADDFDSFLTAINDYLRTSDGKGKAHPSLLAHSMGNIIIAELAKDEKLTAERGKIFNNIVLSSAAVKSKRHHKWLKDIGISDQTYVMVNPKDPMLRFAGILRPNMLGREIKKPGVSKEHGYYIHLEDVDVDHRYFVPSGQKNQSNLYSFYSQALTGIQVDLAKISEKTSIDGIDIFGVLPG